MALVRYDPTPLLRPCAIADCECAWEPFHALGLGALADGEAIATALSDDGLLRGLRRQVTVAYHALSRACRGRGSRAWLMR